MFRECTKWEVPVRSKKQWTWPRRVLLWKLGYLLPIGESPAGGSGPAAIGHLQSFFFSPSSVFLFVSCEVSYAKLINKIWEENRNFMMSKFSIIFHYTYYYVPTNRSSNIQKTFVHLLHWLNKSTKIHICINLWIRLTKSVLSGGGTRRAPQDSYL